MAVRRKPGKVKASAAWGFNAIEQVFSHHEWRVRCEINVTPLRWVFWPLGYFQNKDFGWGASLTLGPLRFDLSRYRTDVYKAKEGL